MKNLKQNSKRQEMMWWLINNLFDGVQAKFARAIKKKSNQVNQWLKGDRAIGDGTVYYIEMTLNLERGFMDGKVPFARRAIGMVALRDIPVIGTLTWKDGGWSLNTKERGGFVKCPSADEGAYAIRIGCDKLRPRIKAGEFVVVEPTMDAQPGDDVVVRFRDDGVAVHELRYIRGGEACLGSVFGGRDVVTVSMAAIKNIHSVVSISTREKFYKSGDGQANLEYVSTSNLAG